jgi:CHAT domain-containing protein/Tfp pilus assembly protein PilF
VLIQQGVSEQALKLLQAEPPIALADSDYAVRRRIAQAAASSFLQRYSEADNYLLQAEQAGKKAAPELLGEVALRRGTLEWLQGNLDRARIQYRTALEFAQSYHQPFLETASLGSLGLTEMKLQHYDEAIDYDLQALQLSESLGAKASRARILGNLGWSYFEIGDVERAEACFREAEKAAADLGAIRDQIMWLTNIGLVDFQNGNLKSAEGDHQRALGLARSLGNKPLITQSLNNLAFVALARKEVDRAEDYGGQARALAIESRDDVGASYAELVAGRCAFDRGLLSAAEPIFKKLESDGGLETSLRIEARTYLAKAYAQQHHPALSEQQYRRGVEELRNARSMLRREESKLSFQTTERTFLDDYINFLIDRDRKKEALEVADRSRANSLREALGVKERHPTSASGDTAVRKANKGVNSVILSYWLGPSRSFLWSISPSGIFQFYILPPQKEIASYVRSYREALLGPWDVLETKNPVGQKLFEMLVAPAQSSVTHIKRVVIIPDGVLYGLNFETLLVSTPHIHYWINDVIVTIASSIALLANTPHRRRAVARRLLLIGDPLLPRNEYPPLPQAASEINDIRDTFAPGSVTVDAKSAATASEYLQGTPGEYSFIHFVAHGTANRTSPLDSAIVLSPTGESFKLYARDIIKVPLHADLVTISSCYGAGSRAYEGEGLVGLSWAFLRAGAHRVIGALWEANDASTPLLMHELYSALRKGYDPASSLRMAKLSLIRSGGIYRKPYYWAAFQIYAGS